MLRSGLRQFGVFFGVGVVVGIVWVYWQGWIQQRVLGSKVMMAGEGGTEMVIVTPTSSVTELNMVVVGDVMLSRSVMEQMIRRNDWTWPFASMAGVLAAADVTLGNLETPVLTSCPPMVNRMVFCTEDEALAGLQMAGFDGMSLANNHSSNAGLGGIVTTEQLLEEVGIAGIREGETETLETKGLRIGLVAFDDVSKRVDESLVAAQVASAAATHEVVVVIPHWGVEYVASPSARQVSLAHQLIEAGANVIVGAHPHWAQTVERYHDGLIIYSLGNFVFDQMWSQETREGYIADIQFTIQDSSIQSLDYELLPITIYDYGQPRFGDRSQELGAGGGVIELGQHE